MGSFPSLLNEDGGSSSMLEIPSPTLERGSKAESVLLSVEVGRPLIKAFSVELKLILYSASVSLLVSRLKVEVKGEDGIGTLSLLSDCRGEKSSEWSFSTSF